MLATPRLLAWCEAATCAAIEASVTDDQTSVGTRVQLEHTAASPVGAEVRVTATVGVRRRAAGALRGGGRAGHPDGDDGSSAHGEVTRVVVDRERFLDRLP